MSIPTKSLELLLEAWRDHSKTGFHVTFLVSPQDQEFFKSCADGQRFTAVLVKLTDQEEPAPLPTPSDLKREEAKRAKRGAEEAKARSITPAELQAQATLPVDTTVAESGVERAARFPAGMCGLAVRWCGDEHFQLWLEETYSGAWLLHDVPKPDERAKAVVCEICTIKSRTELDTDTRAGNTFRSRIMEPYKARREEDGVDDDAPF